MNCGWSEAMIERFMYPLPSMPRSLAAEEVAARAIRCESSNHWAMAAMLWNRIGEKKKSESCETILYNLAINPNLILRGSYDI